MAIGITGSVAIDATSVSVDSTAGIVVNGYIRIGNELMKVTVINEGVLTVVRARGCTVATAYIPPWDVTPISAADFTYIALNIRMQALIIQAKVVRNDSYDLEIAKRQYLARQAAYVDVQKQLKDLLLQMSIFQKKNPLTAAEFAASQILAGEIAAALATAAAIQRELLELAQRISNEKGYLQDDLTEYNRLLALLSCDDAPVSSVDIVHLIVNVAAALAALQANTGPMSMAPDFAGIQVALQSGTPIADIEASPDLTDLIASLSVEPDLGV